jgi:hypothetical protein
MNEWLAAAPAAQLAHGAAGCRVSISDMADREPCLLSDGEVIDIGGWTSGPSENRSNN